MNKKFSTLLATLLVAGGMSSVSAITSPSGLDKHVKEVKQDQAYHLYGGNDQVLVMTNENGVYKVKFLPTTQVTDLASSLWTISYVQKETSGPDFTFVNKATGAPLSVNLNTLTTTAQTVNMGGNVSSWKWLPSVKKEEGYTWSEAALVSYFKSDSVVYLAANTNNELVAAKEDVNKIGSIERIWVSPFEAQPYTLSAKDLNTKLGTDPEGKNFQLSATPELTVGTNSTLGNIFTKNTYRAWDAAYGIATSYDDFVMNQNIVTGTVGQLVDGGWVFMEVWNEANKDDAFKSKWLIADTAYIPGLSVNNQNFVKFADTASVVKGSNTAGPWIESLQKNRDANSALFKFTYFATQDSIAIEIKGYKTKAEAANETTGSDWTTEGTGKQVILNQLTSANELTLGNAPANIKFTLGEGTTNRVSKDNGVYVIKNKKGQYLAVPIYNTNIANGDATASNAAEWVTVIGTEQDVMRMPAYQWVMVKKDSMTVAAKEVSAMTIVNREFDKVTKSVQFRQNEGAQYLFAEELKDATIPATDSLMVEAVAADVIADEALGYLNLKDEVLSVMTYKFNYLHAYAEDKFMGMMEDSILNVKDNELSFFMKESAKASYGYTTEYVPGLKQLTRVKYTPVVKTANGERYITIDEEGRYKLTDEADKKHSFYLKENNFYKPASKEAKQAYYAFIDLVKVGENDSTKMGSADQDLNVILRNQVLEETRTSAFAVVENNAPLYRRLNTALEGNDEGNDAPAYIKFHEQYVNDYLMDETNENFKREGMSYLGIGATDIAEAGLSFYVRPFNIDNSRGEEKQYLSTKAAIKPQYLIYVNDNAAEQVEIIPCDKETNHVDEAGKPTDEYGCSHAEKKTTNFNRYKLLVSLADSAALREANNNTVSDKQLYKFGKYTRVGFVDAIEFVKDSVIYILGKEYANVKSEALDTAAIKKCLKGETKIDLKTAVKEDKHHPYTWSFRYIDPENVNLQAADEDERAFLIESEGNGDNHDIAPLQGAWLKNQNNCLVLSELTSEFVNAKTGSDNALIFNIDKGSKDDMATENESISATGVSVVATEGAVIVKGAEGKNVVINNVLGQTIANTVVTSSEATIAAPQGVVVVAVEGEAAVKAIVK